MKKALLVALALVAVPLIGSTAFSDREKVACGGEYGSYEHSRDGTSVCAGGEYGSYEHSRDGTSVCAGGEYGSYEHSRR